MTILEINNRTLEINFDYALQGHRVTVMEYTEQETISGNWQILANWNFVLCLGATHFDTLCNIASDLFEEAAIAETMAQQMGIEMRFYDDVECVKCGRFDYSESEEMLLGCNISENLEILSMGNWDYVCSECYFEILTPTPETQQTPLAGI
jgi:predicted nucleic-acid-binding Zn-ribbon protein